MQMEMEMTLAHVMMLDKVQALGTWLPCCWEDDPPPPHSPILASFITGKLFNYFLSTEEIVSVFLGDTLRSVGKDSS